MKKKYNGFYSFFVLTISFSILLFYTPKAFSQPDPIKYGKMEKSLLEMKVYDKDTTCDAVVVCDFGNFDANSFDFTRIYRLKILKKSGCDRANFRVAIPTKSNIRGFTYNLVNGEIVKDKLKSESIFEERVSNRFYRYRVSMPNVQVGSVVDIEFTFPGIPFTWYFQRDIPVIWSELRLFEPAGVGIQKNYFGFQPLSVVENGRWVGKDMPALKDEPFMNSLDNFLTKFELEFSYVNLPGWYTEFATSWEAVNNILLNKSNFGEELRTMFFMGDDAKNINDTCKTKKAKMIAAVETIKKRLKWNEEEWLFPKNNIKYTLGKGSGNAAEVNIALILLLKKLDIEAYPIALSTRSNGMLTFLFPSLDKLNYAVALAKIDGTDYLLDATEEYLPAGYLPERCINGNGRFIDDKASIWTELKPGGKEKTRLYAEVVLQEDGSIKGDLNYTNTEYSAYQFRKKFFSYNDSNEFIKSFERENPGIHVVNTNFFNIKDIYQPANVKYKINYSGQADVSDSTITFFPFFVEQKKVNPFKLDTRKTPVDFICASESKYMFRYIIPSGYAVVEKPKPVNLVLPSNAGKFTYRISTADSVISLSCEISLNKALFDQKEYLDVKQLFAEIVKKQAEPITIRKK